MERKALGKGINALFPEKLPEQEALLTESGQGKEQITYLSIEKIKPNPFQPRKEFDSDGMQDLIQSIREKGVIQPVLVRQKGDTYELIAGERRFRAATELKLQEIPAIIKTAEDIDSLELSLIENIQRQNLNVIEEARAFQYLMEKFAMTQERVSEVLGKSRENVANIMRLLKLPLEIQEEIKKGRISYGHGRALLEIQDPNKQRMLMQDIISKSLSVRELENIIKSKRLPREAKAKIKTAPAIDPLVAVYEEELQHTLATKVKINRKKKRGNISIEFYSQEDLERIVAKLRGEK